MDAQPQEVQEAAVSFADFLPGEAVLHLGGQYHSAKPIESGERANLIVWLHGPYGVVRFAPHDEPDRLTAAQRWRAFATDAVSRRFEHAIASAACGAESQSGGLAAGCCEGERHDEL